MPDPRDFLPQPPWEGPPMPEGFVKAFRPTPEQVELVQQINDKIRRRTTYGVRTERIEKRPAWKLVWSNSSADWYRAFTYSKEYTDAFEQFTKTSEYHRLPGWAIPTAPGYPKGLHYKVGENMTLDANEVLVYGKASEVNAILSYLEPLPLYKHSFEAKQRGFGTSPPPWTKHWTWPKLATMPVVEEKQPKLPQRQIELICAVCGMRFEEYRSAEEKLLSAVFGATYCPEHRLREREEE